MKITVTNRVDLDARSNFFTAARSRSSSTPSSRAWTTPRAGWAGGDDRGRRPARAHAPAQRGPRRPRRGSGSMVEGGGIVHTQFLADDLVDELQLVVAPSSSATRAPRAS
jgi:5-amino-6-(5-phosphoribosylamino)uracil reductase